MIEIQWVVVAKIAKILDTTLHDSLQYHDMPTSNVVRWCWVAESGRRRDQGRLAGLTPTPYQSGESAREQGITKSGNRHVRWMTTELAWSWLRYQPESALSCWFRERFGGGGKRLRRIGIVAVARKLLIALWRFLETGVIPEGAELKVA